MDRLARVLKLRVQSVASWITIRRLHRLGSEELENAKNEN